MNAIEQFPVCIVSRNKLFRAALKVLLQDLQFAVLGEFNDVEDVPRDQSSYAGETGIKLIVFDLSVDSDGVLDDLTLLQERMPSTPIVVLTERIKPQILEACLAAGVGGYLMKDISLDALKHSLLLVTLGEKVYPSHLADMLVSGVTFSPIEDLEMGSSIKGKLSAREREILSCLVRGDSNKVIALRLRITEATVKVHMKNLLRKIAANNRTQAAIWAVKHHMPAEAPPEAKRVDA